MTQRGTSIIGVLLMIIVLGLFFASGLRLVEVWHWTKQSDDTKTSLIKIQTALEEYASMQGRYPCPAAMTAPIDTAEFGVEAAADCSLANAITIPRSDGRDPDDAGPLPPLKVRVGTVPVRTLGLDDSFIMDGWDNRLVYAITESYAMPGAPLAQDNGAITITDSQDQNVSLRSGNAIYALTSSGPDTRGAYTIDGIQKDPCNEDTFAGENCDSDATFKSTTMRRYFVGDDTFAGLMSFKTHNAASNWYISDWSNCECAHEDQTRTVECHDAQGNVLADALCSGTKPAATQDCPKPVCDWAEGPFGACSNTCGSGTENRTVRCVRDDNNNTVFELGAGDFTFPVPQEPLRCLAAKPATSQACNDSSGCTYAWVPTPWSACPVSCGGGTQTRTVSCRDSGGNVVANALCDPALRPVTTNPVPCNPQSCQIIGTTCAACPFGSVTPSPTILGLRPRHMTTHITFCRLNPGYRGRAAYPNNWEALVSTPGYIHNNTEHNRVLAQIAALISSGAVPDPAEANGLPYGWIYPFGNDTGPMCQFQHSNVGRTNSIPPLYDKPQEHPWVIEPAPAPTRHWRLKSTALGWAPPTAQSARFVFMDSSPGQFDELSELQNRPCAPSNAGMYLQGPSVPAGARSLRIQWLRCE